MNERLRVQLEETERERKADSWLFSHEKKNRSNVVLQLALSKKS